jgi:hypothetical protein
LMIAVTSFMQELPSAFVVRLVGFDYPGCTFRATTLAPFGRRKRTTLSTTTARG